LSAKQEGEMTSVAMASHRSSGTPGARAKAQVTPRPGPAGSRSAGPSPVLDGEDLDDLRAARGIGLGLALGLGSWGVVGSAAWLLLA
jgi:hypothetical protein